MSFVTKDLNLLRVFLAIWEERNLSKAASRLFVSQSAVSHSLKKMREEFKDSLFVRSSRGVSPTDFAIKLAPHLSDALFELEKLYEFNEEFDLKKEKRKLVVTAGDYFSMTQLERFTKSMNKLAPEVRVFFKPVSNVFQHIAFETGDIHVGITAIDFQPKEGFYVKVLHKDYIACCVRKKHPLIKRTVSLDKYLSTEHINVSNFGSEFGVIDLKLNKLKAKRNVKTVVSSFYDAGRLVACSDLVLSAPRKICDNLAKSYDLKVVQLPFIDFVRPISMVWHERTNEDVFHKEIRNILMKSSSI